MNNIRRYVLPWFEQVASEDGYRRELSKLHNEKRRKEWLEALENTKDKSILNYYKDVLWLQGLFYVMRCQKGERTK